MPYLYRFFKEKEHRDQFVQGLIRFGLLAVYREIEDEGRRDIEEGKPKGTYRTDKQFYLKISNKTEKVVERGYKPGDIFISGDSPNKFFIVSLSSENVSLELLSERFGKYIVKINNPQKLLDLLNKNCTFLWNVGKIVLERVKYDKGNYITMEKSNPHLPIGYYYAQKPKSFADEDEWRIVLTGSAIEEINKKYVIVDVGSLEGITSTIDL